MDNRPAVWCGLNHVRSGGAAHRSLHVNGHAAWSLYGELSRLVDLGGIVERDVDVIAAAGLPTVTYIESRAIWRNRRGMIYVRYYHQRLYSQKLALPAADHPDSL